MTGIGGNKSATIQTSTIKRNAIGEQVQEWTDVQSLFGWLDMMTGSTGYGTYSAKIMESTHVFLCDYVPLAPGIKAETARMIIDGEEYDVTCIDNPMGLNAQLEIFLKYTGGQ